MSSATFDRTSRRREASKRSSREILSAQYLDAEPGHWIVWSGGGIFGRTRYACAEHRGDLVAHLRKHYGNIGWQPWAKGPYKRFVKTGDPARARKQRRMAEARGGGLV